MQSLYIAKSSDHCFQLNIYNSGLAHSIFKIRKDLRFIDAQEHSEAIKNISVISGCTLVAPPGGRFGRHLVAR